jgi:hypothetical protein
MQWTHWELSPGEGERLGREALHSLPSAEMESSGAKPPPLPSVSLWHGAQFIKPEFTFSTLRPLVTAVSLLCLLLAPT